MGGDQLHHQRSGRHAVPFRDARFRPQLGTDQGPHGALLPFAEGRRAAERGRRYWAISTGCLGFAVSTFRDYDEFGKAYAAVLLPHAKVTPAVTAMAAKLTEGLHDPARPGAALVRLGARSYPLHSDPAGGEPARPARRRAGDRRNVTATTRIMSSCCTRCWRREAFRPNSCCSTPPNDATIADPPNIRPMNHLILYLPESATSTSIPRLPVAPFGDPAVRGARQARDPSGRIGPGAARHPDAAVRRHDGAI